MTPMNEHYEAVIAHLTRRRDELTEMIRVLESLASQGATKPKPDSRPPAPRKARVEGPKCGKCGEAGHNARTCPAKKPNGKIADLYRRCGECSQRTPAKGACNHCGAKETAA